MSATHPPRPPQVDPALLRGLTQSRHSRRDLLRLMGMGAGAMGAGGLLSACGVSGQAPKAGSSPTTSKGVADAAAAYWKGKQQTGQVNWANWPLYIDTAGKGNHPSINQFQKQTGIQVNYREVIQDNPSFFATIRPTLEAGQYTGYDTAVISDGVVLTELMTLDYLVPLDQSRLTNFKKYAGAKYRNPQYDPGNRYTIPWQAGFTGLAYDPEKTGREITGFQDLLDPKFKGKIGMFGDASELGNAAMFALGIDAEKSTVDDWKKAAAWLEKVKPNVRKYYEQDYVQALVNGDIWLTQAWSGDIFQSNLSGSKLKFLIPQEGGLLWTDNFLILKQAQNPVDAMMLMDYYYQPDKAAEVAEWVNYITPVPKAQPIVLQDAAAAKKPADAKYLKSVADSYAVFPTEKTYNQVSVGRVLKVGEIDTWNSIFDPIFQS
ncbi:MAG TPA: spermidine/putrescine ABC transporter substrate-binding protein [Nocardioidaceae bacterium]|nr:spermidine/putrescine ABC transporter substrate-binding protein [Nocardioidaceae bacterium]